MRGITIGFLCALLTTWSGSTIKGSVVLVVIDDVGPELLGAYGAVPYWAPPTPNLDALASEAVRFDRFTTSAVCCPTRVTLFTGRYGYRTGATNNWKQQEPEFLCPTEVTLGDAIRVDGGTSILVGKYHLGWSNYPQLLRDPFWIGGFDFFAGHYSRTDYWDFERFINIGAIAWQETPDPAMYLTTQIVDDAIAALALSPELLVVSNMAVHKPWHEAPQHLHTQGPVLDDRGRVASMLEALDTELGRLFAAIDLNTHTVIVIGDNGTHRDLHDGLDRWKDSLYEGGIRGIMLVAGAGVPAGSKGQSTQALATSTDIYATVAALAMNNPASAEDSFDLTPVLAAPGGPGPRSISFSEMGDPWPDFTARRELAAIDARYKLIVDRIALTEEFYDLQLDPGELSPLDTGNLTASEQASYDALSQFLAGVP